jgi:hypothetical protein
MQIWKQTLQGKETPPIERLTGFFVGCRRTKPDLWKIRSEGNFRAYVPCKIGKAWNTRSIVAIAIAKQGLVDARERPRVLLAPNVAGTKN